MILGATDYVVTRATDWCESCGDYTHVETRLADHDDDDVQWVLVNPRCSQCKGGLV